MQTRDRPMPPRARTIVTHPASLAGRPARRRTGAGLGRRERALADLLEPAAVAIHWVGPDGTILWANRAELDLLGYGRGEYVGRHVAEFHADPDAVADMLARLGRDETLRDYPARLQRKDGTIRHVLISSNVRREGDAFVHTRCFTRDATERKRAEEAAARLAAIVDSSEDAVIGKTLDGTVTSWNRGAERLYGYAAEEVVGDPIAMIVPPERREELAGIMERLAQGERIANHDTVRRRKDGRLLDVSVSISPVRDGAGGIIGAATIARDVT
ncbi:MAG: PAS domain S-box protein, partial [Chloroflexota bacterium]|nr:PAS domain S-box protein [Chloroflexota bacterium]